MLGSRGWDLSDFRLQRLNPLPGLQEGEEEGVASQISSSAAAPTEGGGGEGANRREKQGSGAEKGVVWKQGKRQPSQPGLTDCSACREKRTRARGVHVWAHIRIHTAAAGTRAYLFGKWYQHWCLSHLMWVLAHQSPERRAD